uniref:5',3'-nucleotidase, mitochondrial n=1 Tax=Oryzias sinensis TaxID=183150 RepID=A0A8C7WZX8_9TELE
MLPRLRVLVDMDGVLADFEGGFLKKYRARYPEEPFISLDDRRGFWVSAQYGQLRADLCAVSIWESQGFFMDLEPLPGGVQAVREMNLRGPTSSHCWTLRGQRSLRQQKNLQPASAQRLVHQRAPCDHQSVCQEAFAHGLEAEAAPLCSERNLKSIDTMN